MNLTTIAVTVLLLLGAFVTGLLLLAIKNKSGSVKKTKSGGESDLSTTSTEDTSSSSNKEKSEGSTSWLDRQSVPVTFGVLVIIAGAIWFAGALDTFVDFTLEKPFTFTFRSVAVTVAVYCLIKYLATKSVIAEKIGGMILAGGFIAGVTTFLSVTQLRLPAQPAIQVRIVLRA